MIFDKLQALPRDAEPWIVDHQPIIVAVRDERIPPGQVADAAARAATVLRARGVTGGTRCIVWLESPVDIIVAYSAITALGAVPILISPTLSGPTLAAMVENVERISAVVATGERLAQANELLPELAALEWRDVAAALPDAARLTREAEVTSHAAYVVVHTSGTTGVPKLVECSSRSIWFNASVQAVIHWAARMHGHLALIISPVHGRTVVGILAALMRQAPLLLLQDDSAANVERMLSRHKPTYLETHPNTFRSWQHLAERGAFKSVRVFGAGFDVLHPDTVRALLDGSGHRFALCMELYGQNESGPVALRCHFKGLPKLIRRRPELLAGGHPVGPRFLFCQVRILGEDGTPQPAGTPGRIVIRAPGTFSGYLNRPDLSSRNYPKGRWWDTGDWGKRSRLGMLTLVDRGTDRVSAASSAIAVESSLLDRFPELLELVVIEVDGRTLPVASLRPGERFRDREWARVAPTVAHMAEPLVIADEHFPRTITGKVQRAQLKEIVRELTPVVAGA